MLSFLKLAKPALGLGSAVMVALAMGCGSSAVEQSKIDNTHTEYEVEQRPIGIIADKGVEVPLGQTVMLTGRIVGSPIGDRTVRWVQTAGPDITLDDGYTWNMETLVFTTPTTAENGIITYRFEIQGLDASGNIDVGSDGQELRASATVVAFNPSRVLSFEVEDDKVATLTGGATLVGSGDEHYIEGASGQMTADLTPGQGVDFTFTIDADDAGFYALSVRYGIGLGYGGKNALVTVDNVPNTVEFSVEGQITEHKVGTFKFDAGAHTVRVADGWNYYRIDSLLLAPAAEPPVPLAVSPEPVNAAATQEAIDLKTYLKEQYTQGILSGQQQAIYDGTNVAQEHDKIVETAGKKPAIYSFDYMDYSATRAANGSLNTGLTEDMLALRATGTILSAMWHWNAPMDLRDTTDQPWYKGFYTEATTFDLAKAISDENSVERMALMGDLETIADELEKLQAAGVPVLWRPLHEAEGGWFWWGAHGADNFKALWQLMYNHFTNDRQLNNLLWVYSAAEDAKAQWYPGDEYVDIVGYDGYDNSANGEDNIFKAQWDSLLAQHNGRKMIALTETGYVPNTQTMADADAWWSFFVTWNSSDTWGPDGSTYIEERYNADVVINAGDLPGKISGGESPTTPGMFDNFDRTGIFGVQVNWSSDPIAGLAAKGTWAGAGFSALEAKVDLVAASATLGEAANSVIVQTWTAQDGSNATRLTLMANAQDAGDSVTAKLWAKDVDGNWFDGGSVAVIAGGVALALDVSDPAFDTISSFGVLFEGIDASKTEAKFYIDEALLVAADNTEIAIDRFEVIGDFHAQMDWTTTSGAGTTLRWAANGARSMGFKADLSAKTDWGDYPGVVIQSYPEGGIDVSAVSTLSLHAAALNAGAGVTGKLYVKDEGGVWIDGGAIDLASGVMLSLDVSGLNTLSGLGVQFEGLDLSATDAEFYIDAIALDGVMYEDFEGLGLWHGQADWVTVDATTISESEGVNETNAIQLSMDLGAKTDWSDTPSVVLQTYPSINVSGVNQLRLMAKVSNAGSAVTGKLFVKHGAEQTWVDAGPVVLAAGGTILEVDVSAYDVIAGWGVQFEGLDITATEAKFFIDNVEFTALPAALSTAPY
ncbi:glycosyl hydrolase [Marinagarivorans algicola]|uniref:glycosyl hydrolase n=1 Tax=Marinagarivorans algicola TaxID=1513270 RepID=UPI0006B989BE|nr:glycosyl hydrolase [Marinagarivorans algicola]